MPSSVFDGGKAAGTRWPQQLQADFINSNDSAACDQALGRFDLVFSMEVAEHLPLSAHARFAQFLARHTRSVLVFSAGRPGQRGVGHVGNRPKSEWKTMFEAEGFRYFPALAQRIAQVSRNQEFRANALAFVAPDAPISTTSNLDDVSLTPGQVHKSPPSAYAHLVSRPCSHGVAPKWTPSRDPCLPARGIPSVMFNHSVRMQGIEIKHTAVQPQQISAYSNPSSSTSSLESVSESSPEEALATSQMPISLTIPWYPKHGLRAGELELWPSLVRQLVRDCYYYKPAVQRAFNLSCPAECNGPEN